MANYRRLPDGTMLNEDTGTVSAPITDTPRASATAGPTVQASYKRQPSPEAGPGGLPLTATGTNPWLIGQAPAEPTMGKKLIAVAAILGVATLTVFLQNRKKKKKKA
jgi:hypothetical protein